MEPIIYIQLLSELAKIPTRGTEYSAGYDLYAAIDAPIEILPHSTIKIDTGLAIELQPNTFGGIFARSGLSTKKGLRPANCTGVIDADYRGSVIVALHNDTDRVMTVEPQERIAQLIIMPFIPVHFEVANSLTETDRGDGGFGSTGQ